MFVTFVAAETDERQRSTSAAVLEIDLLSPGPQTSGEMPDAAEGVAPAESASDARAPRATEVLISRAKGCKLAGAEQRE